MKHLAFIILLIAAIGAATLYAASDNSTAVTTTTENLQGAASGLRVPGVFGVGVKFKWIGKGFLCLKKGTSCEIEISAGLIVPADHLPPGAPIGSKGGVILSRNGVPVDPISGVVFGGGIVNRSGITRTDGGTPLTYNLNIPEQETVYDPVLKGYTFYYFEAY